MQLQTCTRQGRRLRQLRGDRVLRKWRRVGRVAGQHAQPFQASQVSQPGPLLCSRSRCQEGRQRVAILCQHRRARRVRGDEAARHRRKGRGAERPFQHREGLGQRPRQRQHHVVAVHRQPPCGVRPVPAAQARRGWQRGVAQGLREGGVHARIASVHAASAGLHACKCARACQASASITSKAGTSLSRSISVGRGPMCCTVCA